MEYSDDSKLFGEADTCLRCEHNHILAQNEYRAHFVAEQPSHPTVEH